MVSEAPDSKCGARTRGPGSSPLSDSPSVGARVQCRWRFDSEAVGIARTQRPSLTAGPRALLAQNLHRIAREYPQGELLGAWSEPPRLLRVPYAYKAPRPKRLLARDTIPAAVARLVGDLDRRLDCRPGQELMAID